MAQSSQLAIKNIDELVCFLDDDIGPNKVVLDQIISNISKNPNHISAFITYINGQLSNAPTRQRGVLLLKMFLPLCASELITEHAIAWMNNSLKYSEKLVHVSDDAFAILNSLVETCYEVPELNKSVTTGILYKIVEQVYKTQNSASSLKCLETCLRVYSGPCTSFRNNVEKYLISYVDCSVSLDSVRCAGKCLHALQQVGGGGAQGINHKLAWKKQQQALCATIHSLMDQLFEYLTEFGDFQHSAGAPLELPKLPIGNSVKLTTTRIINIVIFLQEMLLGAYPTAKPIMPKVILDVISRGLAVTSATLGNLVISETISLSMYLNLIHKHFLQLLQASIISLGGNLIPFATVICKLIINNLKCTSPKDAVNIQSFCELRVVAYQTLAVWMTVAKSASCVHIFDESIIPMILTDVTPAKNEINLAVQNSAPKHMTKKSRKKLQQEQITESTFAKSYSPITKKSVVSANAYESKICTQALCTLQNILINIGYLLKPLVHKQLQEFVVQALFNIQRGIVLNPYNDSICVIQLYKTLTKLVTNHHWNMSPPLEYTILLLSNGQTSNDPRIASICSTALSNLKTFIHPPFATLQFPLDIEGLKNEFNKTNSQKSPTPNGNEENGECEMDVENSTAPEKNVEPVVKNTENLSNSNQNEEKQTESLPEEEKEDKNKDVPEEQVSEKETVLLDTNEDRNEIKENGNKSNSEEIIEIPEANETQLNNSVKENMKENLSSNGNKKSGNSSKTSYSVHIEILSDDEVMEQLTIDDEPEHSDSATKNQITDKTSTNKEKLIGKNSEISENVIDLVEDSDMCSAFVDIVNE